MSVRITWVPTVWATCQLQSTVLHEIKKQRRERRGCAWNLTLDLRYPELAPCRWATNRLLTECGIFYLCSFSIEHHRLSTSELRDQVIYSKKKSAESSHCNPVGRRWRRQRHRRLPGRGCLDLAGWSVSAPSSRSGPPPSSPPPAIAVLNCR